MKVLQGKFTGRELRIGIVAARFNEFITSKAYRWSRRCTIKT